MTAAPLSRLQASAPWTGEVTAASRNRATLRLRRHDRLHAVIDVERCATGRLRGTYPAGGHDVEIAIAAIGGSMIDDVAFNGATAAADVLRQVVTMIWNADDRCRRIVLAVAPEDHDIASFARSAGFRHGVDVDVPGVGTVDLLVIEPAWATGADLDLDRVPTG
ncbi:hypothetical protein [Actinomadura rudentiformis]|uniref:GNAT family N-acetyltransferase n=1 Tax=Actinomadura rudentiformis TaxID=359158 RepID=A0A6H9YN58_9ACTN|nr:hypothetical protein [Actinomadura rudentiformis]KAB2340216.1 hypothetical protein F8566_46005 [Actinomadura rudentiformis]